MKIGLRWYQKSNGSKCTYDLNDRMMVHLDIIFALASVARVPWFRLLLHLMVKHNSIFFSLESESGLYIYLTFK